MTHKTQKFVVFLRGINVGGHHKVPMAELRAELKKLGFEKVVTILNSGNILLESEQSSLQKMEDTIEVHLEKYFGFSVPTIVRRAEELQELFEDNPFEEIEDHKDIRLYISLLKKEVDSDLQLPWSSADESYKILEKRGKDILSVLDLSVSKTTKAMKMLEDHFGKNITTRNWKTIDRIVKKIG